MCLPSTSNSCRLSAYTIALVMFDFRNEFSGRRPPPSSNKNDIRLRRYGPVMQM